MCATWPLYLQNQITTTLNLKKSSYLTTFACDFGRYRFMRLAFRVAPVSDMFQWKIDKIFKDFFNLIGITDDIVILDYDAECKDCDGTLRSIMQICHQENKNKCHFKCLKVSFCGKIIPRCGVEPEAQSCVWLQKCHLKQ